MKKVFLASALFAMSTMASAVQVTLTSHVVTTGSGTVHTLITDGSRVQGTVFAASSAVWDWDGTTLTGTGLYSATLAIGDGPIKPTIQNDSIVDLTIATGSATASATVYRCNEGSFLSGFGASACGGYRFGSNSINESATIWSGTCVAQTIGGDDVLTFGPRTIAAYNFGLVSDDGMTLVIGTTTPVGTPGGEAMTFQYSIIPIPAAAWLFGSALGLLGWVRRSAN